MEGVKEIEMEARPPVWVRVAACCLWLPVAASAVACAIFPVMGVKGVYAAVDVHYSADLPFRLLAERLVGPVFTFSFSLSLLLLILWGKRVPWWLWLIALGGPLFTAKMARGYDYYFSLVLFRKYSGYESWINGLSMAAGGGLVALAAIACFSSRRITGVKKWSVADSNR